MKNLLSTKFIKQVLLVFFISLSTTTIYASDYVRGLEIKGDLGGNDTASTRPRGTTVTPIAAVWNMEVEEIQSTFRQNLGDVTISLSKATNPHITLYQITVDTGITRVAIVSTAGLAQGNYILKYESSNKDGYLEFTVE